MQNANHRLASGWPSFALKSKSQTARQRFAFFIHQKFSVKGGELDECPAL
jgi:hypothetical protein